MDEILYVDSGEKEIISHLKKKGIAFETQGNATAIGDMRKGDTVIERKKINDFMGSMIDGNHLQNQYIDMTQYPQKWVIVCGYFGDMDWRYFKYIPQFYGMLARLARQGICFAHVKDDAMLVSVALSIMDKAEKAPEGARYVKRNKDATYGIVKASAERLPWGKIKAMLDKFETPLGIAMASREQLMEVEGVGWTLANRIWENFRKNEKGEVQEVK